MDWYIAEMLIRQRIAEVRRHAAQRRLLGQAKQPLARRRGWCLPSWLRRVPRGPQVVNYLGPASGAPYDFDGDLARSISQERSSVAPRTCQR